MVRKLIGKVPRKFGIVEFPKIPEIPGGKSNGT